MQFAALHSLDFETPISCMLTVVSTPNSGLNFYLLLCSWGSKWTREACLHFYVYLSLLSENNMQNFLFLDFRLKKRLNNQTDTHQVV